MGSPNRDSHFPHCFVDDTYIGYRVRGILGALTAAAAFVLPAFDALPVLSAIYFRFQRQIAYLPTQFERMQRLFYIAIRESHKESNDISYFLVC